MLSQILCARAACLASLQRLVTLEIARTVLLAALTPHLDDRAWMRAISVGLDRMRVLAHHRAPSALAALQMRTPTPPRNALPVQSALTLAAARPSAMSVLRVRWTVMEVPSRRALIVCQVTTGNAHHFMLTPVFQQVPTVLFVMLVDILVARAICNRAKPRPGACTATDIAFQRPLS